jgi:branched-chain amino acid transport system ATP-binding protein
VALLDIQHLTMIFGGLKALDNLELRIGAGEIMSVIGPNGAGRRPLQRHQRLYRPTAGRLLSTGGSRQAAGLRHHRPGIARTFQNIRVFPNLTVLENIMVGMHCRLRTGPLAHSSIRPASDGGVCPPGEGAELLLFGDRLLPMAEENAVNLSYANRRRLEIARALAADPQLLLLTSRRPA